MQKPMSFYAFFIYCCKADWSSEAMGRLITNRKKASCSAVERTGLYDLKRRLLMAQVAFLIISTTD